MSSLNYKTNFLPLELQGIALHKYRCLAVGTVLLAVVFLCSCWMLSGRCASLKSELVIVQKEIQDRAPAYKNAALIKKNVQQQKGSARNTQRSSPVDRNGPRCSLI